MRGSDDGPLLQLPTQPRGQRLAADEQPGIGPQVGRAGERIEQLADALVAADGTDEGEDRATRTQAQGFAGRDRIAVDRVLLDVAAVRQHVQPLARSRAGPIELDERVASGRAVQDDGIGVLDDGAMGGGILLVGISAAGLVALEVVHGPDRHGRAAA